MRNAQLIADATHKQSGLAVINLHSGPRLTDYLNNLRKVFESVLVLRSGGNNIVAASHRRCLHKSMTISGIHRAAQRIVKFAEEFSMHPQIAYGARFSLTK